MMWSFKKSILIILDGLPIYIMDLRRGNFIIKTNNPKRFESEYGENKAEVGNGLFLFTSENKGLHKGKIIKSK